jgi:phosphoglycolate phosphatase-like HAD superfamily hydrolase
MTTSRSLGQVMASARCILLDFDGPICSVFSGWPAPDVAAFIRVRLVQDGHPLSDTGLASDDPLDLLIDAARESPEGGRRAEDLLTQAEEVCVTTATPAPGGEELLRAASSLKIPVVIVSNNAGSAIRKYLGAHLLTGLVLDVVGRPADPQLMKPDPHLVLAALRIAGAAPDVAVFIGDSPSDAQAARAAGVAAVSYADKPHKENILEAADVIIVTDLREITEGLSA